MARCVIEPTVRGKRALAALPLVFVAILAWFVAAPAAQTPSRGKSAATITGAFADSCRDFAARSSKDISYVELHYVTGPVVKDESINSPDHAIDGGAGQEIEFATVKSGTTIQEFGCVPTNRKPTALLEIKTPPVDQTVAHCYDFFEGGLACEQASPRTDWTSTSQFPDPGALFTWGCGALTHPSLCSLTMSFRITRSSDPDGDITSWSLDFGDGTSASGNWSTGLPTEVVHEYTGDAFGVANCHIVEKSLARCIVTLTVTDSAGQSDSDTIQMVFVFQGPD